MATVMLRFSPFPAHTRTARLLAASLGRRLGLDEVLLDEVKLAVGEACARAVGLHRDHRVDELVEVCLSDDDGVYAITVSDRGPADADLPGLSDAGQPRTDEVEPEVTRAVEAGPSGDPDDDEALDTELVPGLGLALVASLVEDVTVTPREAGGSDVRMSWPLPVKV